MTEVHSENNYCVPTIHGLSVEQTPMFPWVNYFGQFLSSKKIWYLCLYHFRCNKCSVADRQCIRLSHRKPSKYTRSNSTGKNIIKYKYCMYSFFSIVPKIITHFHLFMRKVVLMIYPFHDHCSTRQLLCCRMFYMCYIFIVSTYATNMRKIITHF